MTKTSRNWLVAIAVLIVTVPFAAFATNGGSKDLVRLGAKDTVDGNYYAVANNVVIEGHVTGDVICAGESVTVKGDVDGDIICAAQNMEVSGNVGGSVRVLAGTLSLNSRVARNVTLIAANAIIDPKADIGMDALFLADNFYHLGKINGSMRGTANTVAIAGKVVEDVNVILGGNYEDNNASTPVIVQDTAKIGGSLIYQSSKEAYISKRQNISGSVIAKQSEGRGPGDVIMGWVAKTWIWVKIAAIFSALIIGFCVIALFRKQSLALSDYMIENQKKSILWGVLLMIMLPIMACFLMVTIIGFPVAMIIFLLWMAVMMLAKPLAAITVGHVLLGRYKNKVGKKGRPVPDNPYMAMALGVVGLYAVMIIPIVGYIIGYVASAWTIGAAWMALRDMLAKKA